MALVQNITKVPQKAYLLIFQNCSKLELLPSYQRLLLHRGCLLRSNHQYFLFGHYLDWLVFIVVIVIDYSF